MIYTRGRTGSELLIDLLRSNPTLVCEGEILGGRVPAPRLWVRAHATGAARAGAVAYGFKTLYTDLGRVQKVDPSAFLRHLSDQGYLIVHLVRRNLLRQAVSWLQATQQQTHYRDSTERSSYKPVRFDPETLIAVMLEAEYIREVERERLQGLPHVTVSYEEDLLDASRHQATADAVFQAVGLSSVPVSTSLVRSSARSLSEALENYEDVAALVGRSRFAEYLT